MAWFVSVNCDDALWLRSSRTSRLLSPRRRLFTKPCRVWLPAGVSLKTEVTLALFKYIPTCVSGMAGGTPMRIRALSPLIKSSRDERVVIWNCPLPVWV